jgi:hypothetical protein
MTKLPMTIQDLVRIQDVKRWTVVNMTRTQSVAEHTCLVFFIAVELATRIGISMNSATMQEIMLRAMLHDIDEIHSGDIPTPAKNRMGQGTRYGLSRFADKQGVGCAARLIVKMADFIETSEFIGQYGEGVHAVQVMGHIEGEMHDFMQSLPEDYKAAMKSVLTDLCMGQRTW